MTRRLALVSAREETEDLAANIAAFARHLDAERKSKKTILIYRSAAEELERFLRAQAMPLRIADIEREHLEHFLGSLRDRYAPATMNQTFRSLQAFWKYLIAEGEVEASPLQTIARPTIPDNPPAFVTPDQMKTLLRATEGKAFVDRRDHAMLAMFYDSGVRRSEMAGIQLDDLDLDQMQVAVTGKFSRLRYVRFQATTTRALDRYLRVRATHPERRSTALWLGERGPLTSDGIGQMVERRTRQAGLRGIHPHSFRHGHAHEYLSAGGAEGDLMQGMGWRSRSMVDRYARSAAGERSRRNYDNFSPMERLRREGK